MNRIDKINATEYLRLILQRWRESPYIQAGCEGRAASIAADANFSMIPMIEYEECHVPCQGTYPRRQWIALGRSGADNVVYEAFSGEYDEDAVFPPVPMPIGQQTYLFDYVCGRGSIPIKSIALWDS